MLEDNDIVSAVLNNPEAHAALRVIAHVAVREVALRASALPPVEDVTTIGDLTIDRLKLMVTVAGEVQYLKPREFALIETLARRVSFVFSRARLLELAWTEPEGVESERTVDVHIKRLRSTLGRAVNIRTVKGVGYALDPPKRD